MADLRSALQPVAAREAATVGPQSAALRLANALDGAAKRGAAIIPALQRDLMTGLEERLDTLRLVITAGPVTLETLPPELRRLLDHPGRPGPGRNLSLGATRAITRR